MNYTALNLLHFKVSYLQRSFTRPVFTELKFQRKRRALKTVELTERLKIKTVLFSRLFDLQNSIIC